jgi:hypothetical protein
MCFTPSSSAACFFAISYCERIVFEPKCSPDEQWQRDSTGRDRPSLNALWCRMQESPGLFVVWFGVGRRPGRFNYVATVRPNDDFRPESKCLAMELVKDTRRHVGVQCHPMENVDFFALPRTLQERIVGGIEGRFPPMPMLVRRVKVQTPWKWIGLSAGALVAFLVVHRLGFGDLQSALARHPLGLLPVYALLLIAFVFGVLATLAAYVRAARLPYPPGVYAYAGRVLDARSHPIRSFATSEVTGIEQRGSEVVLQFAGSESLSVAAVDESNATSAVRELQSMRDADAPPESRMDTLSLIDPLYQPRFSNPVGESIALSYELPVWVRFGWALAIAVGAV